MTLPQFRAETGEPITGAASDAPGHANGHAPQQPGTPPAAIEVVDVHRSFGSVRAVAGMSMRATAGRVTASSPRSACCGSS